MRILDVMQSPMGTVYLGQRQVEGVPDPVYEILIGDEVLMSSLVPVSEKALATRALAMHPGASLRVLVGGLGLGYTAQAALADDRVSEVRVIEKMDFVIDWMRSGSLPLSEQLLADARLQIDMGDAYHELLAPASEPFDVILLDIDHAPDAHLEASEASARFYRPQGQLRVAQHLRRGGILGVWSTEPDEHFLSVLRQTYESAHAEEITWDDPELPEADFEDVLFFARAKS